MVDQPASRFAKNARNYFWPKSQHIFLALRRKEEIKVLSRRRASSLAKCSVLPQVIYGDAKLFYASDVGGKIVLIRKIIKKKWPFFITM